MKECMADDRRDNPVLASSERAGTKVYRLAAFERRLREQYILE
jgi:hypothetical protein